MKRKLTTFKKEIIAMFFLVLLGVGLPILLTYEKTTNIEINSDQDLLKHRNSGQGTLDDPYIIENLTIIDQFDIAISIKDTTKYFIVRNCYFANNFFYGLYLENIADGTAQIENVTCFSHSVGIGIFSSSGVNVSNSILFQNGMGIEVSQSSNIIIMNNYVAVAFPSLDQHTPKYDGFLVQNSSNVIIRSNTIEKNARAILLEDSDGCLISSNVLNKITHIGYSLDASSNCVLYNNSIEKYSFYSFKFAKSHFNIIENNTITDTEKAFYLSESNDNIIKYNAAFSNGRGIQDFNGLRNNISFNIFQNTAEAAIDLSGSSYFNIHHNSFFFNNLESSSQSMDSGLYNLWFDSVQLKGNYWNDYNDTGYYQIGGTANSTDPYPLTEPLSYSYKTQFPNECTIFSYYSKSEGAKNCGISILMKALLNKSYIAERK